MKVAVIGLGLMGGSFALDIQSVFAEAEITGIDARAEHLEEALSLGIIHKSGTLEDLSESDWVILSIPVDKIADLLPKILDKVGSGTIVFDTGSTKANICKAVAEHPNRRNYVATHPIAGTEFSGPSAALKGLFKNQTNIICEVEKTAFKLQEQAVELFRKLGMRIRYMDPVSHDKHIAYVSHLSHVSSFMLGKTVIEKEKDERDIFDMAGSGFASTVRLAKSSPETWTSIFMENRENVSEALDEYIGNLQHFKQILDRAQAADAFAEMENTNKIKNILNGIN